MANIKQQIKRNKTNEKARLRNKSFKSACKTAMKKVNLAVEQGDKTQAILALNAAYKKLDMGQSKGIYHKNFVARHKSNLALKVNQL